MQPLKIPSEDLSNSQNSKDETLPKFVQFKFDPDIINSLDVIAEYYKTNGGGGFRGRSQAIRRVVEDVRKLIDKGEWVRIETGLRMEG